MRNDFGNSAYLGCYHRFAETHTLGNHVSERLFPPRKLTHDISRVVKTLLCRVLQEAGVLERHNHKPSTKGKGFVQPLRPHEHWHVDVSYLNIGGTYYFQRADKLLTLEQGSCYAIEELILWHGGSFHGVPLARGHGIPRLDPGG